MNTILLSGIFLLFAGIITVILFSFRGKDRKLEQGIRDEIGKTREETFRFIKMFENSIQERLKDLTSSNETRLERLRTAVETQLKDIQKDSSSKLEIIRATVDEKLHATLEKRLGESFRLVSERLEEVHKGLGEMQNLAVGVGDLKKVLSNVKTRGTLGEIQLESLLEQVLSPEQYDKNVATKPGTNDRVEFAVLLPGVDRDGHVWLPIDAKFPQEDYQRLIDAREKADQPGAELALKQLVSRIKLEAKNISDKYLSPPETVDFGILFLPLEGLYAEVLNVPGLQENLQKDYHVAVNGPTTLYAFLTSLRMGFRTLAIQKRSGDVWNLLATVRSHFGKFGELLEKTRKKLDEAGKSIDDATRRSRTIEHKLNKVQEMGKPEKEDLLIKEDS